MDFENSKIFQIWLTLLCTAVVVFGLGKNILFKSILGLCELVSFKTIQLFYQFVYKLTS